MKHFFLVLTEQKTRLQNFLAAYPQTKRLLIILAIALLLPLTVIAALTVQNIRQQASENGAITVIDPTTNAVITTTDTPNIALKITLPADWTYGPVQSMKKDSDDDGLIKKAHADFNASTCVDISVNNGNPVSPGQSYPAVVSIRNDGDTDWTWDSPNPYKLGSQDPQDNTVWSLARVDLPTSPIRPGQTATFRFTAWAPETPNSYNFNWQMLQENVDWFGSRCYHEVTVNAPPSAPTEVPTQAIQQQSVPSATPTPQQEQILQPTAESSDSPTQTPQEPTGAAPIHVLKSISIQNVGSDEQPITYSDNLQQRLENGIDWSLPPLQEGETQGDRVILITLSDGNTEVRLQKSIILKESMGIQKRTVGTNQNIPALTDELLNALNPGNTAFTTLSKDQQLTSLTTLAKDRKEKLLQELRTNPQAFLDHATLINQRDKFPQEVQPYIEQPINQEGTLFSNHTDQFEAKKADYYLGFETDDGKSYDVYPTDITKIATLETVTKVKLNGVQLQNVIAFNTAPTKFIVLSTTSPTDINDDESITDIRNNYKSGVVKISGPNTFPSDKELEKIFISNPNSVRNYFKATSYGEVNPDFDFIGEYEIDNSLSCSSSDEYTERRAIIDEIEDKLKNNGVNLSEYSTLVILLPFNKLGGCIFDRGGEAFHTIQSPQISFIFTSNSATNDMFRNTVIHELGHNFEFGHSGTARCGYVDNQTNTIIRDRAKCGRDKSNEYGDEISPMGSSSYTEMGALHKYIAHWLPKNNVQEVTSTGVYKIDALATKKKPDAVKLLIIKQSEGIGGSNASSSSYQYLYALEYRTKNGLDQNISGYYTQGVSIYVLQFFNSPYRFLTGDGYNKGVLQDKQSFYDKLNNITITQISHNDETAYVEIKMPNSIIPLTSTPIPTPTINVPYAPIGTN